MIGNEDMPGKLANIKKMRMAAGSLALVTLAGLIWVLAFYFLYPSEKTGHLAMCWLIFMGFILPFCWPVALFCCFLSIFLPANAVLVLTAAFMMIAVLIVLRAVYLTNKQSYNSLLNGFRAERYKSVIFGFFVSILYFVNAGNEAPLAYGACFIYQLFMVSNFILSCYCEKRLRRMDFREIFGTDWKNPYGQA